ncbi:hypothetical protein IVB22_15180 [Bradyrhizobium sp. 190]|uniref:hypothetical protein n=1 Tax=Bradyrhizobium sp. 190 TaxID=2782658 RepID=UPI001FF808B2|nr:hypothetical protein [Bradyrhizobium sp. 190]MCK1513883.1 hypothetical protein [Bradyrhizobium sp. 190]
MSEMPIVKIVLTKIGHRATRPIELSAASCFFIAFPFVCSAAKSLSDRVSAEFSCPIRSM